MKVTPEVLKETTDKIHSPAQTRLPWPRPATVAKSAACAAGCDPVASSFAPGTGGSNMQWWAMSLAKHQFSHVCFSNCGLAVIVGIALLSPQVAPAQGFSVIYTFGGPNGAMSSSGVTVAP